MALFSKFKEGLKKTRASFSEKFALLTSAFQKVDEEFFEELEEILVLSDMGAVSATEICEAVKMRAKKERITDPVLIKGFVKEEIAKSLSEVSSEMKLGKKPSVIIVIGVNGVGKTTTIGKLAAKYKKEGKKVILAAADTFRAAAAEQLSIWADRVGVQIVKSDEGADPGAVLFDAITSANAKGADIVICDTAGRLHNKKPLMDELSKIYRVIEKALPETDVETLLVIDATTGQNGVIQAEQFSLATPITGIVLTKLDGTAKGGIVVPICKRLHIPVKFVGLGEGIDDLEPFSAEEFSDGLIGD
jgi:fused signal recognition particle receptor